MLKVALVTTSEDFLQGADVDLQLIISSLSDLEIEASRQIWHDPEVDWAGFDLLLMRSPWDYPDRLIEFLGWFSRVQKESVVLNHPSIIRWSLDKCYLLQLETMGVEIVPVAICSDLDEAQSCLLSSQGEVVLKPNVSVGSRNTGRFMPDDHRALALAELIFGAQKKLIVQPCVESVASVGELGLVYFDGVFSHAVRKGPILSAGGGFLGGQYNEDISPAKANESQKALANQAAKAVKQKAQQLQAPAPLYARFDIVEAPTGPQLLEAELFEPSLFLGTSPGSAARFALAVKSRL